MNPTLLAAEIVTALDNSQGDSRLNRCETVQGMIEREMAKRETIFDWIERHEQNDRDKLRSDDPDKRKDD